MNEERGNEATRLLKYHDTEKTGNTVGEARCIEARNKAGNYFKSGYNCAESIFLAYKDDLGMDANIVKLFTGFGRGLGEAGCVCGALMGAISVIGLLTGRTTTDKGERDACYSFSKEFHDRFKNQFKTTCCRVLNSHDFKTREHAVNCLKITGETSKMLMGYLLEKQLIK